MTQNAVYGNGQSVVAFSTPPISGKTVGSTLLAMAAPNTMIITQLVLNVTAISLLTTPCTISLGSTQGGSDIMPAVLVTGLGVLNNVSTNLLANTKIVPANTPIYLNVTLAALATTFTFRASIIAINLP